jgi:hypothetical protein
LCAGAHPLAVVLANRYSSPNIRALPASAEAGVAVRGILLMLVND